MVGSNGIWPDGEPQSVREAYENQRHSSPHGRKEIPMTPEQRFALMTPAERARVLRDLETTIHLNATVAVHEGSKALNRLCKIYGIK